MANEINYTQIYQEKLDKAAVHDMLTGWMDSNAGQVKYNGGKEVKIPQLTVDGLGDYDRGSAGGYAGGDVQFSYKTYEMTQDRGRKFSIDAMDVDETGFILTASTIMGEFQRTKVIPEIDAYRLSGLATKAMSVAGDTNVDYGYAVTAASILEKVKLGIKTIRENGYNGQLVIHASYDAANALEMAMSGKIASVTFSQAGIDTKVAAVDQCPIIPTPSNRLYSAITLYDGVTEGQKIGGYVKGTSAIDTNFIIVPRDVPIAVTKQDVMRIFDPKQNQQANAWAMDYRRYHDIWVLDNKLNAIYANFKDTKPSI